MADDEKPDSIWKKEVSFRRRPAGEGEAGPAEESTSVWKKEISLRKKAKDGEPEAQTAEAPPAAEPPPAAAAADDDFEAMLAQFAAPGTAAPPQPDEAPASAPAAVEHDWLTKPLEEVSEPPAEPVAPISLVPAAPPVVEAVPTAEPQPEPEPEPEPVPEAVPVAEDVVLPEPELDAALDLPTAVLPPLPDEPAAAAEPEVEPEPAAEALPAPVEAQVEPRVPFYKKELSLKRTPKAAKAPKEPRAPKEPKAARPAKPKRRRGAKEWDAAEPAAESKPKLRRPPRPKPSLPSLSLPSLGGNANRIVGLKIGGSQIAAARVQNGESPELLQAVREPLEHGIVVGGELRDPEALAVALKAFFSKHGLPKRGVRLGIANNRIGVRTFEVTGIEDPKQLANAIRFRAQEVLPIPIEEAVLDYQVLSEGVTEDGQPLRRVLLVVAYRELVDRYVYACRKAGLQIVGIDLEAFALLRAISEPYDPVAGSERGALVAVSVGHDRSTFAVSDGRVCEFTRVLEWGGWSLNVAIARALDLSPSEVEGMKRSLTFTGVDNPATGGADQLSTAREAARRQLQTFARELVSSLQFYQNQPGSLGIGEIVLTGGTAHLPGLGAELQRLIGVPVRIADPMNRVKVSKKVRERDQVGSLAVAIGLGIDD